MMHKSCFLKVVWAAQWDQVLHFDLPNTNAVRKIGKKEKVFHAIIFLLYFWKKICYSLDRGEGCFRFLSLCSPSPRITYKITFKRSLTCIFLELASRHQSNSAVCKGSLAVVCGAIADNLWWALWHHVLGSDGPNLQWKRAQKASDGLMKLREECREWP